MGSRIVQTYATPSLTFLEENLYEIIGKTYGNDMK